MADNVFPAINAYMFSSELCRLSFDHAPNDASAMVVICRDNEEIFRCEYYPDTENRVTVYDLDRLLEARIPDGFADFSFTVRAESLGPNPVPLGPEIVRVFRSSARVSEPAESFLGSFFLTTCCGERDTAPGRFETLTAYCPEAETMVVERTYYAAPGKVSVAVSEEELEAGWRELDVSPDRYSDPALGILAAYSVRVGNRVARYRVNRELPAADPVFVFRNCFHAWETVSFTGTKETTPSYDRSQAMVGGRTLTYLVEETLEHKALTGPLRPSMVPVIDDLCRSREVFLLNPDGSPGEEVVITDCDLKRTNEDAAPVSLSVTYRLAERLNAPVKAPRPPRIFDSSFDRKFN